MSQALTHLLSRPGWAAVMAAATLASLPALATDKQTLADARARYESERAVCLSGKSNQDRETCLKEAGAAYDQARRGETDPGLADYRQNALKRCAPLPEADRSECVARLQEGSASGSVEGGGILREKVTVQVGSPTPPAR